MAGLWSDPHFGASFLFRPLASANSKEDEKAQYVGPGSCRDHQSSASMSVSRRSTAGPPFSSLTPGFSYNSIFQKNRWPTSSKLPKSCSPCGFVVRREGVEMRDLHQ